MEACSVGDYLLIPTKYLNITLIDGTRSNLMRQIIVFITIAFICVTSGAFAATDAGEAAYKKASKCYHDVKSLPKEDQNRAKWFKCVKLFESVAKEHSESKKADDAVFSAGLAYRRTYEMSEVEDDARDAVNKFAELVRMHGKSNLADDALFNIATLKWEALNDRAGAKRALYRIISWYPQGDMALRAADYLKELEGDLNVKWLRKFKKAKTPHGVYLKNILKKKLGSGEKLLLEFDGPVKFSEKYEGKDTKFFAKYSLEFENAKLSRMLKLGYSYVGKGIVRDIIPKQIFKDLVQVGVIIKKGNHCITKTKNNFIEMVCMPGSPRKEAEHSLASMAPVGLPMPTPQVDIETPEMREKSSKQLVVVIDPGHGGDDEGAVGPTGLKEKDIVLQIAKRLGWQLRNKYGMDVNYTRIDDRTISLDDRNAIANSFECDLFISIHANAAESNKLDGYQTFFLNNATDEASRRLASRENASLGKSMGDLEQIILTMMQNANTDESRLLAKSVHKNVLSDMSKYGLKDRGVRSALFYVLVGAKCPAILIETSFISNPEEEKKLMEPQYQEKIARSVASGIHEYLTKRNELKTNL